MIQFTFFRHPLLNGLFAGAALLASPVTVAQTATTLTAEQGRRVIAPFYDMLNKPATKDLKALTEAAIAPDWRS